MTNQDKFLFAKKLSEVTIRPINYGYVNHNNIPAVLWVDIDNLKRCEGALSECNRFGLTYRQRTKYEDEQSNWRCLCKSCQDENDSYWDDMWKEYYAGVM